MNEIPRRKKMKKKTKKTIQKEVWIRWICYLGAGGPTPLIRGYLHLDAQWRPARPNTGGPHGLARNELARDASRKAQIAG